MFLASKSWTSWTEICRNLPDYQNKKRKSEFLELFGSQVGCGFSFVLVELWLKVFVCWQELMIDETLGHLSSFCKNLIFGEFVQVVGWNVLGRSMVCDLELLWYLGLPLLNFVWNGICWDLGLMIDEALVKFIFKLCFSYIGNLEYNVQMNWNREVRFSLLNSSTFKSRLVGIFGFNIKLYTLSIVRWY